MGVLEGAISDIGWVRIVGGFKISWDLLKGRAGDVVAVAVILDAS